MGEASTLIRTSFSLGTGRSTLTMDNSNTPSAVIVERISFEPLSDITSLSVK
jgi:hypothetical protein